MKTAIQHLDRILRGDATLLTELKNGALDIPAGKLVPLLVVLAAVYGCCMGWYGLFNYDRAPNFAQLAASSVKVPMLYGLTLLVTFPSLYVFNALVGSRLTLRSLLRLMVASMGVTLAVLASFGPIVAFFSVSTTSHPFILLLNVAFCAVAGFLGMLFLLQTLHRISVAAEASDEPADQPPSPAADARDAPPSPDHNMAQQSAAPGPEAVSPAGTMSPPPIPLSGQTAASPWDRPRPPATELGALDKLQGQVLGPHVKTVFRCWVILFALVGSQMSWVLRPFIGNSTEAFHLFEPRESNFFQAVWETARHLCGL